MAGRVEPLQVNRAPCGSCPYKRSTPPGVWHPDEYRKLPDYDRDSSDPEATPPMSVFLCHLGPKTGTPWVCRGWLHVHRDSIAVRLAVALKRIPGDRVPKMPSGALYRTGAQAAEAGLRGCKRPKREAVAAMVKITRKRARRGR